MKRQNRTRVLAKSIPSALILCIVTACSPVSSPLGPSAPPSGTPGVTPTYTAAQIAGAVQFCFEETNRLRARAGAATVQRAADQDVHAANAARADHLSGQAHGYTMSIPTRTWWENEVLRASHVTHPNLNSFVALSIDLFWREGPGSPHYESLIRPSARFFGCGVYVDGDLATVAQQFRP